MKINIENIPMKEVINCGVMICSTKNSLLIKGGGFMHKIKNGSVLHKMLNKGFAKSQRKPDKNSFPIRLSETIALNDREAITCQFCKINVIKFVTIPCAHPLCFRCKLLYFKKVPVECNLCNTLIIALNKCF